MSGGSYDYISYKIDEAADTLIHNHKQPHVRAFAKHLHTIANLMHDIEWADSGDTSWNDKIDACIKSIVSKQDVLDICTADAQEALKNLQEVLDAKMG